MRPGPNIARRFNAVLGAVLESKETSEELFMCSSEGDFEQRDRTTQALRSILTSVDTNKCIYCAKKVTALTSDG